jgi:hypothetical protein
VSQHADSTLVGSNPPKPTQSVPTLTASIQHLLDNVLSLLAQYSNICYLLQTIVSKEEEELAVNCLSVIHSGIKIVYEQVSLTCTLHSLHCQTNHFSLRDTTPILKSRTNLWHQLFYPHLLGVRRLTHEVLIQLEQIIHLLLPTIKYKKFSIPSSTSKPSVLE